MTRKKISRSRKDRGFDSSMDAVWVGSGNVFADLGLPDADEMLVKADLAHRIGRLVEENKLTQAQAAARLGIDQPKISALLHGRLKDFSTDRLIRFLNALDQDVEIVVKPRPARLPRDHHPLRVVAKGA